MTKTPEEAAKSLVADFKGRQGVDGRAISVVVYRGDPENPIIKVSVNPGHPHRNKINVPATWQGYDVTKGSDFE